MNGPPRGMFQYTGPSGADPAFSFVALLIHANGANNSTTFTDNSTHALTVSGVGGAKIDTSTKPYGTGSILFNGTTDALSVAYDLSTNVFYYAGGAGYATVEFWIKHTTSGLTSSRVIERADAGFTAGSWMIDVNDTVVGDVAFYHNSFNPSTPVLTSGGVSLNDGNWHHVAVTRSINNWTLWVDGVSKATRTSAFNAGAPTTPLLIGKAISLSRWLNGRVADIRLTGSDPTTPGGSIACRYTAPFTPPTSLFPDF